MRLARQGRVRRSCRRCSRSIMAFGWRPGKRIASERGLRSSRFTPSFASASERSHDILVTGQVCDCERIGDSVLKQDAEVLNSRNGRFQNPFPPKTPRMLTPQTIHTEGVSSTDSDELALPRRPYFSHISVSVAPSHASPRHWPSHDKASLNQARHVCVEIRRRDQMRTSKAEQQPPQYLEVWLLVGGLAKTTVQNTLLLCSHH